MRLRAPRNSTPQKKASARPHVVAQRLGGWYRVPKNKVLQQAYEPFFGPAFQKSQPSKSVRQNRRSSPPEQVCEAERTIESLTEQVYEVGQTTKSPSSKSARQGGRPSPPSSKSGRQGDSVVYPSLRRLARQGTWSSDLPRRLARWGRRLSAPSSKSAWWDR
jgi:hypothetical protein